MISRVAEACFWLHRYIERMESTARLLHVNRGFVLDVPLPEEERWAPVIVVSGEQDRFPALYSADAMNDAELVQEYLTWNEENPVSIASSLRWARENARSIREVISLELWETINAMWHWMRAPASRREYRNDRDGFYTRIKEFSALAYGVCDGTMLREQPFDFMRLGMLLERAGQTARILDVRYSADDMSGSSGAGATIEAAICLALLRSCSASEPFFKKVRQTPRPATVLAFILCEASFPRSVYHCVDRAWDTLQRVRREADPDLTRTTAERLSGLRESLSAHTPASIADIDVHAELTRIIDETALVCDALHAALFDPVFRAPVGDAR